MSNTAFALSPISARATSPTEADFEAIREAFVETARGRWFLDEYTRRNRNADTALVLDAVARIERTLVAQKELKAEEPQTPPAPDLTETLTAIKAIIAAARDSAEAALSGPPMDEALTPTRKCARVIREIAWGLRESGADGRICSLLDSQVDAINAACDRLPVSSFRDDVLGAFDQAVANIDRLAAFEEVEAKSPQQASASVEEAPSTTHDVSDNVVAFSSVAAATSSQAEAPSANISLADVAADAQAIPEAQAFTTQASEQEAAPVEAIEAVTQASAQPEMAVQTDASDDVSPAVQIAESDLATSMPAEADHIPSETVVSEVAISEEIITETSDGIALDDSLFDLSAETAVPTSDQVEVHDTTAVDVIEAPVEVAIETAAEGAIQQPTSAQEPDIAASEPDLSSLQPIAPVVATGESSIAPQVVESLEAMADVAFEETAADEALSENTTSEAIAVVAQDLSSDDVTKIVGESEEAFATNDIPDASVSAPEPSSAWDIASAMPSEDAPSMAPDEVPSAAAKTPLPDIMIGGAVAVESYAPVRMEVSVMEMSVAPEAATVSATNHLMSLAATPTPDAITPSVSLGASLIANGIVQEAPRNDPLAAIRRMTQAERIAFFS